MKDNQTKMIKIAIDGPVAAGKGTVARLVAKRLGILYVDTGAMYRVAAFLALQAGVSWENEREVADLVSRSNIELRKPENEEKDGRLITVIVDGDDVSWKIRTEQVSEGSSAVAVHAKVRAALVEKQQAIAQDQSVVMEGRDTTFRVLPNADVKIFLTATAEERAQRRHRQLIERGEDVDYGQVLENLKLRDKQDMGREVDPLQIVSEAWELDTTGKSIEEVVTTIVEKVEEMGLSSRDT